MGTFRQDLRFTLRALRRSPGFALAAIATLALGIGATTAIFSTVNAALLKPLPYPQADNLYSIRTALTDGRVTTGFLSGGEVFRLNDPNVSVVRAAGMQAVQITLIDQDGNAQKTDAFGVTEGFFELFGLPMTLGGFTHEQHQAATNGPPVVVISYRLWQQQFGGDPAIVGKPIRFAEIPNGTMIAGVANKDFDTPHDGDIWFTQPLQPDDVNHSLEGFIRLKPGASIDQVRSQGSAVMAGLAKDFPAADKNRVYVFRPVVEQIVGDLGPILIIVLSATALLLVLACVNVTNLLLARGAARAREMAVRVALGAARARIVRQLLTESVVLATCGTLLGLIVAWGGLRLLMVAGVSKLPRLQSVPFDTNVLLFALGALVVSGFIVGFAPALRLAKSDLRTLMNESGRSAAGGRATGRWLSALTIAEVAVAVMLVAGSGWLIRSFASLRAVHPGFATDNRLLFDVSFQGQKYPDPPHVLASAQDLLDRLRRLPGVVHAGTTSNLPLRPAPESSLYVQIHGESFDPANPLQTRQRIVSPQYFDAIGTKIIKGRDFSIDDRPNTTPVVLVNKTFVDRNLPGRDPIGVHFASGYPTVNPNNEVEIIGVVEDVRQKSLSEPAEPSFYSADTQLPTRRRIMVVETQSADPLAMQTAIRGVMREFDPQMPLSFDTLSGVTSATLLRQQLGMMLMMVFGGTALLLAAVGIYGVIAYAASQRQGEVATRLALGATPGNVFWLTLREGRTLALIGAAIGLAGSYAAGRVVASKLYAVQAGDPLILAAATVAVALITLAATMIPAIRASRLNPSRVLHGE